MAEQLNDWYNQQKQAVPTSPVAQGQGGMLKTVNNWQNTPEQTVQGQTESVIRNDSPLMQLARTQADQESQKRGLLHSSVGIGAAQDATYRAALPIAEADAAQAARVAGYNTDTLNKAEQFNAGNQFSRGERELGQAFQTSERQGQEAFNVREREANNAYDLAKTREQNTFDYSKLQYTEQNATEKASQGHYADLSKSYNETVAAINADVKMTRGAKTAAIKQIYASYKAQLSLLGSVGKVPDVSVLLSPPLSSDPNNPDKVPVAPKPSAPGRRPQPKPKAKTPVRQPIRKRR